jgi:hypothetical protein
MSTEPAPRRCIVRFPGNKRAWGVIQDETEKRYLVLLDLAAEPQWVKKSQVRPDTRKPTAKLEPPAEVMFVDPNPERLRIPDFRPDLFGRLAPTRPIPKPEAPEECPAWLAFVRKMPCCNCGSTQNVEAHHEGKKGVGQKVRDTMAVPLCSVPCHRVYTDTNCLPDPVAEVLGKPKLRTRADSLLVLRAAQEDLLKGALVRIDQQARIELLSKALASQKGLAQVLGRIEVV